MTPLTSEIVRLAQRNTRSRAEGAISIKDFDPVLFAFAFDDYIVQHNVTGQDLVGVCDELLGSNDVYRRNIGLDLLGRVAFDSATIGDLLLAAVEREDVTSPIMENFVWCVDKYRLHAGDGILLEKFRQGEMAGIDLGLLSAIAQVCFNLSAETGIALIIDVLKSDWIRDKKGQLYSTTGVMLTNIVNNVTDENAISKLGEELATQAPEIKRYARDELTKALPRIASDDHGALNSRSMRVDLLINLLKDS